MDDSLLWGALALGLLSAFVAHLKGRSFPLWLIYGTVMPFSALPHSFMMRADRDALEERVRRKRLD